MKKRKSNITAVLAVISAVLVSATVTQCNTPTSSYSQSAEEILHMIDTTKYTITPDLVNSDDFALIDLRSPFEYEKGHIDGAVNVYSPDLLEPDNQKTLNEFRMNGKILLLYGNEPDETLPVFMTLSQLDMGPVKILKTKNYFDNDKFITVPVEIEKPTPNIKAFIEMSGEEVAQAKKQTANKITPPPPVKVAPKKKKKKKMPEGGC